MLSFTFCDYLHTQYSALFTIVTQFGQFCHLYFDEESDTLTAWEYTRHWFKKLQLKYYLALNDDDPTDLMEIRSIIICICV